MAIELTEKQKQDGWQVVKFGEIAKNISERVDPTTTDLDVYVGLEHLDSQSLRITRQGVPSDVKGQKLRVRPGQIIFGKRRAYQKKVAVADFDGICSAHAMVLEAISESINPELLPFFMQSEMFMERAVAISEGSLSPTIKWKILAVQEFPLPSIERQKTILEVLKKVEECRVGIDCLFRNGVGRKQKSGAASNLASTYFSSVLVTLKKTDFIKLSSVTTKITDGTHGKVERDEKGTIDFLYVSCVEPGKINYESAGKITVGTYERISAGKVAESGDVLYSVVGSYGNAVVFDDNKPVGFQRHIALIKLDSAKINPMFLQFYLNSSLGKATADRLAIGNAQKTITLGDLRKFPIPILPLESQAEVVDVMVTLEKIEDMLACKQEFYSSIGQKVMRGLF